MKIILEENLKPKLLLVDDDPDILQLITRITSNAGYEVVQANDGQEALNQILADCPDMLLTDWDMPGLDGVGLCSEIRRRDLPFYVYVLLLTSRSRSDELIQALDAGADDFISKPINAAVLLARLKAGARTVALQHRLRQLSDSDPLTGILNRRAFHERFAVEWERAVRYRHPLSCVMIDIDFFKKLNDTYGHTAGDVVLQEFVRLLKKNCRASDVLARFGGEEFCLILPETDEAGAATWAEHARFNIAEAPILFADQLLSVSASFGVAARTALTSRPEVLLDFVDQALGFAKESGRNRVVVYSTLADRGPDFNDPLFACTSLDKVFACDVMAPAAYCPHASESMDHVADLFLQLRLNAAPVVDDEDRLVGIISENDLLRAAVSHPSLNIPVRDCMTKTFVQYNEKTPILDIIRFLSRASVPRVIVIDNFRPRGVISRATLLHWLRNWATVHGAKDSSASANPAPPDRDGILKAVDLACDRLTVLRSHLSTRDSDIEPCTVAEVTRLEDLAHDILAHCLGQPDACNASPLPLH